MIDVSEKVGSITYPIQNPDRVQKTRQRRETIKRDRSDEKRKRDKRKKSSDEDNRLDKLV